MTMVAAIVIADTASVKTPKKQTPPCRSLSAAGHRFDLDYGRDRLNVLHPIARSASGDSGTSRPEEMLLRNAFIVHHDHHECLFFHRYAIP